MPSRPPDHPLPIRHGHNVRHRSPFAIVCYGLRQWMASRPGASSTEQSNSASFRAIGRSDEQSVLAAVAILSLHEFRDDGPEDDGLDGAFRVVANQLQLPLTLCTDRS
jgi:hypothetical protein